MKSLIFIFLPCLLLPCLARADTTTDVIINEVAWMGTLTSANDEWIELSNQTDAAKNIDGWLLKATDGSPKIKLTGTISAKGFWLLERTDDNTLAEISADQIYTGALNNTGEALELYDNAGKLIDSIAGDNTWPAGDNSTKQTMERKDVWSWQTSQNAGGTPKTKNSAPTVEIARQAPTKQSETVSNQKESVKDSLSKGLAATGEQIPQSKGATSIVLFAALALAVFSGITILILKKGLK